MYNRYCELKKIKGYKDADIARISGVAKSTLSDWKHGKSIPKQDKLKSIADCLNVTLDYLVNGEKKETELPEQADLWIKIRHDNKLIVALEKYFELSEDKKKHVIDTIDMLSEA